MNDKELADKCVALGVLTTYDTEFYRFPAEGWCDEARIVVRDWQVAGAMMEKCQKVYAEYIGEPEQAVYARAENNRTWEWVHEASLPRAIIEACVEAQS